VYLTSPYFIPDVPTIQALLSAAMRGVDVRVMVPANSDVPLIGAAVRSYYRPLVRGGVRLFEYQPAMLHAKTMVVDGSWGIVGSANVDIRSFYLNFELSALVIDPTFAAELELRFREYLADCHEIGRDHIERYGWPSRLWHGAVRLLSPLL
jgi:cardiolipin synthase